MARERGLIRPYSFLLIQVNRMADALLVFATMLGSVAWWQEVSADALWLALLSVLIFAMFAESSHLYRSWRVAALHTELSMIWRSWFATVLVVVFVLYLLGDSYQIHKMAVVAWLVIAPVLVGGTRVLVRLVLRVTRSAGRNFRTAAIVGATPAGRRIAERIVRNRWMGIRLIGYFDERRPGRGRELVEGPVPIVGGMADLRQRAEGGELDIVYVALPMRAETRIKGLIEELADGMVLVYYVADFEVFDLLRAQWETLGEIPVLRVIDSPFHGFNSFAKRVQDIGLASILLLMCTLPMLAIAAAVRLTSPGPAIYRQVRHGLDGVEFTIYKFRTMRAEDAQAGFKQATRADPRVTRVGRFLRRTSLDELPQLINVLQGRMSLVGPRPHPLDLNEQHRRLVKRFFLRHKVRPGITGWAQVNGYRGETESLEKMQRRLEHDLEYINNWSFWLDLRILLMTVARVWKDGGAY